MVHQPADVLVHAVSELQQISGTAGRGSQPQGAWKHTCLQLLQLLNDYPGGVSTPVLETHLWAHRRPAVAVKAACTLCMLPCLFTICRCDISLNADTCAQDAAVHKQSSSSTLAQLVHGSDAQPMQPAMLRDVHVDGVLCGPDGGAALRDQPANGAVAPSVPMLLLRDASMQQSADSIAHYVHSGLRGLFSGPAARLGAGAHRQVEQLVITTI